jgi:hypothetical protein
MQKTIMQTPVGIAKNHHAQKLGQVESQSWYITENRGYKSVPSDWYIFKKNNLAQNYLF